MARLGEFGRAVADQSGEVDTFLFHGEEFTLPAALSVLPTLKFAWQAKAGGWAKERAQAKAVDSQQRVDLARTEDQLTKARGDLAAAEAEAMQCEIDELAAAYEYIRASIGVEQWPRFEEVANRVGAPLDELMEVCAAIVQEVTARPTRRPSASAGGPSRSGGTSMGGSGSRVLTAGPSLPEPDSGLDTVPWDSLPPVWGTPDPVPAAPPVSPGRRQQAEFRDLMVPVSDLIRSGG